MGRYGTDYFERVIVFRPHNIYGPNMGYKHVIPQIIQKIQNLKNSLENKLELIGDGIESRAFCHVNDAVEGIKILMSSGENGEIYHIGNDTEEIQIKDLANRILKAFGASNIIIEPGIDLHIGGTRRRCPSIEKIKKLGFSPKVTLDYGLEQTVNWYKENLNLLDTLLL